MENIELKGKINKYIFAEIAKEQAVFVDTLGTISVKNNVTSKAVTKVVTLYRDKCGKDIMEFIEPLAKENNINHNDVFEKWLKSVITTNDNERLSISIPNTMVIEINKKSKVVKTSLDKDLEEYLNPNSKNTNKISTENIKTKTNNMKTENKKNSTTNTAEKPKQNNNKTIIAIIVLLLICGVGYFIWESSYTPKSVPMVKIEKAIEKPVIEEPKPVVVEEVYDANKPEKNKYYLVVGVFYESYNAPKYIKELQAQNYKPYTFELRNRWFVMLPLENQNIESNENLAFKEKFAESWFHFYR